MISEECGRGEDDVSFYDLLRTCIIRNVCDHAKHSIQIFRSIMTIVSRYAGHSSGVSLSIESVRDLYLKI